MDNREEQSLPPSYNETKVNLMGSRTAINQIASAKQQNVQNFKTVTDYPQTLDLR